MTANPRADEANYSRRSALFEQGADADPQETLEWLEALDAVLDDAGSERCEGLLLRIVHHARQRGVSLEGLLNTPYCNTVAASQDPPYPGDLEVEQRLTAIIRWNAVAMVVRANRESGDLGGHLASYASAADLFEVGFNHFFRGDSDNSFEHSADLVFFQPHSAPGIYARAFLEGRITEDQLANFRREVGGQGLSSYPHPRLMPDFWQFPTGSMGLGPVAAIYQARFMRYMQNRGLLPASDRKVWAFVGDGEMDEPESLAGLTMASRENLDNLIFVVNCNLQRLDGPVRGNGSIIQELERLFAGAGWNVVKLLWGSDWDDLFARDRDNAILRRLHEVVDGELQSYGANDAGFNRQRFFNKYPELQQLVSHLSDPEIDNLKRGGHDPLKVHAAFDAAVRCTGVPTVVLAQTKKGYGLGRWAQGRMSAHQHKKLSDEALRSFRDRFDLPMSEQQILDAELYRPSADSPEMRYLHEHRSRLGGFLPARISSAPQLTPPAVTDFGDFALAPGDREMSTTTAFVRMLAALLKGETIGKRVVPIVADEARTFGMESLFRQAGLYSHCGQLYEPEDQSSLLSYRESRDGQILEEGINEAGALASWIAAGTSYSSHAAPMLPFYVFYSVFGFQRVGDLILAGADSRARGFLIGATSGRTTLSGEGLQHQDGTSHLLASTIPSCRAYDPCYAYELAVILEQGMHAMLERQEDVFYYVTVMNEAYLHSSLPPGAEEGILNGMHPVRRDPGKGARVQLLGSGAILREALAAADILEQEWGVAADVWSVTSFSELRRTGLAVERWNRLHPTKPPRLSWVEESLNSSTGPVVAATDYVRALPDLIRTWVPRRYITLGTDGFGRSDTRAALRRFFEVDRVAIAYAALTELVQEGSIDRACLPKFRKRHQYAPPSSPPWEA